MFIILGIGLPTADVVTDLNFIIELYFFTPSKFSSHEKKFDQQCILDRCLEDCVPCEWGHPNFATALLLPFLLNYILAWLAWVRLEKNKLRTLLCPVLNLYPQYRAGRVVKLFWTKPAEGDKEKKLFERELHLTEVFVESVPTVLILTHFLSTNWEHEVLFKNRTPAVSLWEKTQIVRFYTFFSISVFSAAFGLAKCLKVGVCRTMGEDGLFGGLLSGRFLLAMLASITVLILKGLTLTTVCISFNRLQS